MGSRRDDIRERRRLAAALCRCLDYGDAMPIGVFVGGSLTDGAEGGRRVVNRDRVVAIAAAASLGLLAVVRDNA